MCDAASHGAASRSPRTTCSALRTRWWGGACEVGAQPDGRPDGYQTLFPLTRCLYSWPRASARVPFSIIHRICQSRFDVFHTSTFRSPVMSAWLSWSQRPATSCQTVCARTPDGTCALRALVVSGNLRCFFLTSEIQMGANLVSSCAVHNSGMNIELVMRNVWFDARGFLCKRSAEDVSTTVCCPRLSCFP